MAVLGNRTTGFRDYRTYELAKQNNAEVETSFNWDLRFITKPTGVYLPPDVTLLVRSKSCTPPSAGVTNTPVEAEVGGGYKVRQPGMNEYTDGTFTLDVQDFIDQSVEYAFRNLLYEYDRPLDRTSKPKAECLWDADLYQLDSQDRPVKVYHMLDCLLTVMDKTDTMNSAKAQGGAITLTWTAQLYYIEQLNL